MSPVGNSTPSKADVFKQVRSAFESEFGLPKDEIQLATHLFDDLDLDSIDAVDLAASMEESLGLSLRDDDLKSVRTVQDMVELVHGELATRQAAGR